MRIFVMLFLLVSILLVTGCTTSEKLADGIGEKNISGDATFVEQRIGIDPANGTPVMKSTVITGKYQSVRAGTNFAAYDRTETAAWYNANNRTITERFVISLTDNGDMPGALNQISKSVIPVQEVSDVEMQK